jgi:hypothetical protein
VERRHLGSTRWLVTFVVLALAAVATALWPLLEVGSGGPDGESAAQAPSSARTQARPLQTVRPTRLDVDTGGAALTLIGADAPSDALAAERAATQVTVVAGGARVESAAPGDDRLRAVPTGAPGPWTLALATGTPWDVMIGADAERLELDVASLALQALQVRAPRGAVEGSLPLNGRVELELGPARSTLDVGRGSDLDARITLGPGALLLRVGPAVRGRLELVPGSGPATLIVDATVTVALTLPPGEPPPLALEGTWWRHRAGEQVTWVRSPSAMAPDQAELTVVLVAATRAPLAITYR